MTLSAYKGMWLVAMFDLPVGTPRHRKIYARFRKGLLRDGFTMLQYSIYARYCASDEASQVHRRRVKDGIPEEGEVRVVTLTDHQFGKMEVYVGAKRTRTEQAPLQLELL